jgi:glyoxylase-like metal-dependent hydrolase (beta-lactamase superfamily II)
MMDTAASFSRRQFLAQASCFGAFYAFASSVPVPALAGSLLDDPRISQAPIVDSGFASVRKIGDGLYATISDTSKGLTTVSNGGFLTGKDGTLLIEGFITPAGAAFQMEALRKVTEVPAVGALNTHYHYDHSLGNSFYGDHMIPLWGHANVSKRLFESYASVQGVDRSVALASLEKRVKDAKSEVQKEHAQGTFSAFSNVFDAVSKSVLALPNRPLDAAKLPLKVDLGGLAVVIETYPGHSGTDLIVRVPEEKVVYAGDLLFNGIYPVCFDEQATVSGWRATLKTFSSYDKDTIFVPGHGQICGQEVVTLFGQAFDDVAEQAQKMYKAGVPISEAEDRYDVPEKLKNLRIFAWGFTIGPTIKKLYAEWGAQ